MSDEIDALFIAITPLGFHVRVTKAYWELIVNIKHPVMAGREDDVKNVLEKSRRNSSQ
jgi:hypothetical protein